MAKLQLGQVGYMLGNLVIHGLTPVAIDCRSSGAFFESITSSLEIPRSTFHFQSFLVSAFSVLRLSAGFIGIERHDQQRLDDLPRVVRIDDNHQSWSHGNKFLVLN